MDKTMYYYSTDSNKFYNPYAMFAYAARHTPHTYPTYYFYDDVYKNINWAVEPAESFQSLIERRALQIREKYDKLVLYFSGGTDSMTVYNVFKKLNIHLDEIITFYNVDASYGYSPAVIDWLIANHYDKNTKITAQERDTGVPESLKLYRDDTLISDPNYISQIHPTRTLNSIRINDRAFKEHGEGNSVGLITGVEKPYVMFVGGEWKTSHLDKLYEGRLPLSGDTNTEHFFVSCDLPELHVKQTHMLKNYAKQFINPTSDWFSSKWADMSWQNFATVARWCGRADNIVLENAINQKASNRSLHYNAATLLSPAAAASNGQLPSEKLVRKFEDPLVNKFLNSLRYIQSDTITLRYMESMNLLPIGGSIDRYNGLWGKFYNLGK